ncbi:uncharacterized PE-PGRS family protein PE_PGRS24-like [Haliotis rufescens]|uniref:uncharacterized PE-PGRS family protein PE_PGRS24-like n=1 Tax=Haliotis rufescens TaxID=6454 RepID=UPI001EB0A646|nr:uncharacterized PE-PGRS family protein PE_PGRS24-like [Haliotis rufescens]
MAMLELVLVAALAHLAFGQGWGAGLVGPGTRGVGPGIGSVGAGFGGIGPGFGGGGPGTGGVGSGTGGVGPGIGGAGPGIGSVGPGFGVVGPGTGGVGSGTGGVGPGIGGVGPGFGNVGPGFGGTSTFGLGTSLFGLNIINPYFNTTVTCTGTAPGFSVAVTLKRTPPILGLWWGQRQGGLSGNIIFRTTTATGNFQLVVTERARIEGGCTADGLGNVISSNVWRQGFGQLFGQQWGQGFRGPWGQIFGAGTITQPGVVADVTLAANRDQTLDVASLNLPFRDLERYAGRGLALCPSLTTGANGRQVCMDPVFACCKLGYDNKDGVVPTPP